VLRVTFLPVSTEISSRVEILLLHVV